MKAWFGQGILGGTKGKVTYTKRVRSCWKIGKMITWWLFPCALLRMGFDWTMRKGCNEDINPLHTHITYQEGPITRVRARQLKIPVSSFLGTPFCDYKGKLLPNDIIIFSNFGVDQEVLRERHGGGEDQHGRPSQVGGPIHIKFESTSDSRSRLH